MADIYRQGEWNFRSLSPQEVEELSRQVGDDWTEEPFVQGGETGKKHTVKGKGMKRSRNSINIRSRRVRRATIIKAPEGADVSHEEHDKSSGGPMQLPPGNYAAYPNRSPGGWGVGPD